jgi:hypothetical protein
MFPCFLPCQTAYHQAQAAKAAQATQLSNVSIQREVM